MHTTHSTAHETQTVAGIDGLPWTRPVAFTAVDAPPFRVFGLAERPGSPRLAIAGDELEDFDFADPAESGGKGGRTHQMFAGRGRIELG